MKKVTHRRFGQVLKTYFIDFIYWFPVIYINYIVGKQTRGATC